MISVLVISSIMAILSLSMGLSAISENQIRYYQNRSSITFLNLDGCSDEALEKISGNSIYTGEVLNLGGTTCIISVSGTGAARTVTVSAANGDFNKNLQINVTIFPVFSIDSWQELTS